MPAFLAVHRNARISPRKVRLVADQIRRQRVPRALEILTFSDKRAAVFLAKVLKSAVANSSRDEGVDPDRLVVSRVIVNEGPRLKRIFPRPRGVATPISRPFCHIEIEVAEPAPAAQAPTPAPEPVEST